MRPYPCSLAFLLFAPFAFGFALYFVFLQHQPIQKE